MCQPCSRKKKGMMKTHCNLKSLFILSSQFLFLVGLLVSKFALCSITANNMILNNLVAKGPCWEEWSCLKIRTYLQFHSHHALKQSSLLVIALFPELIILLFLLLWLPKVATSVLKFKTQTNGGYNHAGFLEWHSSGFSLSNIYLGAHRIPTVQHLLVLQLHKERTSIMPTKTSLLNQQPGLIHSVKKPQTWASKTILDFPAEKKG